MAQQLALVYSRALVGITAREVWIEVHIQPGLPAFFLVGLPEAAVKEARHRVQSAVMNAGFDFPLRRIVVSLGPAEFPKTGSSFDLAIAIAIIIASGQLAPETCHGYEFLGELSLSGQCRSVAGSLAVSYATHQAKRTLILPKANEQEALLVNHAQVIGCQHLREVVMHLRGITQLKQAQAKPTLLQKNQHDIAHVYGQSIAKRALSIAAAGGHNVLMSGPPGCGKSMLAACLPNLLPPMSDAEAMEVAMIYSISHQGFDPSTWGQRPFRAPHHSASMPALVGGGNPPKPGEISLAHDGVLFLDELPEYPRSVLEALREPLESGEVIISRAHWQCPFPARTQLIAAMNPCPCGYEGLNDGRCRCSLDQIQRYQSKISGPLLDRIDLHVQVSPINSETLLSKQLSQGHQSESIAQHIERTWHKQMDRAQCRNSALSPEQIKQFCQLKDDDRLWLAQALKKLQLSARSIHRTLKVALTIADLDDRSIKDGLPRACLIEALSFARRTTTQDH